MSRVIGLADINNAFCSFERLFDPKLIGIPLVTASNNDSMIIARSYEAKALGIKMAQPYFQVKHLEKQGLVARSANFLLYANLSARVQATLGKFSLSVIPYSIDESFFLLNEVEAGGLYNYGKLIKATILKHTGQPVGIGIASSRTLAKLCNNAAKNYPATGGVVSIYGDDAKRKRLLKVFEVGEVWGIGKATAKKLNSVGIYNALELAELSIQKQQKFDINLKRTIEELNGTECLEFDPDYAISKSIIASRSLGTKTDDRNALLTSIATHVKRGALKLRNQKALASTISLSIQTSLFSKNKPSYARTEKIKLDHPTADTRVLLQAATKLFDLIYRPGFAYSKTGISLTNIIPEDEKQNDLFADNASEEKSTALMSTIDALNDRFGETTIGLGSESLNTAWQPKSQWRSPNYTGDWAQLAKAKC